MKRVWNEGGTDIYLSGYHWHAPYGFTADQRASYNDWALGGGYGRTLTDERTISGMLYGMMVQDSYRKPMYLAGYGWLARWKVTGEGLRGEALHLQGLSPKSRKAAEERTPPEAPARSATLQHNHKAAIRRHDFKRIVLLRQGELLAQLEQRHERALTGLATRLPYGARHSHNIGRPVPRRALGDNLSRCSPPGAA